LGLVFFGRLSPSQAPSPQPSPIPGEGVALLFLAPLVKPSPECRRRAGPQGRGTEPPRSPQGQGWPFGGPPEANAGARAAAGCAAADPGERFFGYFLVATRKYLAFGCENPIRIFRGRRHTSLSCSLAVSGKAPPATGGTAVGVAPPHPTPV
jgi:hypothetical protein